MKVVIAGSRDLSIVYTEITNIMEYFEIDINSITEVVSGTAQGMDQAGETWAWFYKKPVKRFQANWNTYGKAAGPIRNRKMAEYADMALVIMKQGGSPGSQHMIKCMQDLNKIVYRYEVRTDDTVSRKK